jgi:hypothetical protein
MGYFTKKTKKSIRRTSKPGAVFNKATLKKGHFALVEINDIARLAARSDDFIRLYAKKPHFICVLHGLPGLEIKPEDPDIIRITDLESYNCVPYIDIKYPDKEYDLNEFDTFCNLPTFQAMYSSFVNLENLSAFFGILTEKVLNLSTLFLDMDKLVYNNPNLLLEEGDDFLESDLLEFDLLRPLPNIFASKQFDFPKIEYLQYRDSLSDYDYARSTKFLSQGLDLTSLKYLFLLFDTTTLRNFNLPNLKSLKLIYNNEIKIRGSSSNSLVFKDFYTPRLKHIDLGVYGSTAGIFDCENFHVENLECVRIESYSETGLIFEESFIEKILSLSTLSTLDVLDIFSQVPLEHVLRYRNIDKVKSISVVFEDDSFALISPGRASIPATLPKLESFQVSIEPQDTELFKRIYAENVTKLTVYLCEEMTYPLTVYLEHVPKAFPSLKELYIQCPNEQNGHLSSVSNQDIITFQNLELLQIGSAARKESLDLEFESLFLLSFPKLKVLKWYDDTSNEFAEREFRRYKTLRIDAPLLEEIEVNSTPSSTKLGQLSIHVTENLKKLRVNYKIGQLKLIGLNFAEFTRIEKTGLTNLDKLTFDSSKPPRMRCKNIKRTRPGRHCTTLKPKKSTKESKSIAKPSTNSSSKPSTKASAKVSTEINGSSSSNRVGSLVQESHNSTSISESTAYAKITSKEILTVPSNFSLLSETTRQRSTTSMSTSTKSKEVNRSSSDLKNSRINPKPSDVATAGPSKDIEVTQATHSEVDLAMFIEAAEKILVSGVKDGTSALSIYDLKLDELD